MTGTTIQSKAPTGQIVLVVDDDKTILYAAEAILRRNDYSLIVACSPSEALKKSGDFRGDIDLLLTDVVMPEMDGFTLARQIFAERPQIRILLMSGYTNVSTRLPLLRKPFRMHELLEQVAKVIGGPPPPPTDVLVDKESSKESLRAALSKEVDGARRRYLEWSRGLLKITKDVPSGIPNPDGSMRIQRPASELRRLFEEYQRARKSWTITSDSQIECKKR